jgi:TRAP-type C4-dicarboxylate transport system permease large subunit
LSSRWACLLRAAAWLGSGARLIGNVPIEQTVKPIMGYLGLLFICLREIAFIPGISTALPRAFGY